MVSIGCLNSSLIHPREIFKIAILSNSAGIIIFHNHPSGDPEPSQEDINITTRIKEAGKLMGIVTVGPHYHRLRGCLLQLKRQGTLIGRTVIPQRLNHLWESYFFSLIAKGFSYQSIINLLPKAAL
ncbi:JAB domain-containing protein [Acetobacterium sp.]|uniref:JAB domain-containing protein n=1 Tax=Acetobacterium sp. TaxID=1872094 RepID=UPI002F3F54C3